MLFPRLQPLVAALGWDLLAGKTKMRRKLMQSLWTTKSQALRLEESSPYDNKSDEVNMLYIPCSAITQSLFVQLNSIFVRAHEYIHYVLLYMPAIKFA